jgi:hypothetical protein
VNREPLLPAGFSGLSNFFAHSRSDKADYGQASVPDRTDQRIFGTAGQLASNENPLGPLSNCREVLLAKIRRGATRIRQKPAIPEASHSSTSGSHRVHAAARRASRELSATDCWGWPSGTVAPPVPGLHCTCPVASSKCRPHDDKSLTNSPRIL